MIRNIIKKTFTNEEQFSKDILKYTETDEFHDFSFGIKVYNHMSKLMELKEMGTHVSKIYNKHTFGVDYLFSYYKGEYGVN